ncbi:MAG TPA: NAD-dependent succinate-semialdehyde dehydrogenase [Rhizobiaceae bacterium]|nr:NAD-dependent succinate-semialdehyde dehydrogenase [Rhizobiaceae bacterium]
MNAVTKNEASSPAGYVPPALLIDGEWIEASARETQPIVNPATGRVIGVVPHATAADLDRALEAAQRAFAEWRHVNPRERGKILKKAADLMRERQDDIARLATLEMGKPLPEAKLETHFAAEEMEWFAEEARRSYGRVIPGRLGPTRFQVVREPVGPAAGFSAWNFPIGNAARKLGSALAAGCTMVYKPGEEAPAAALAVARCLVDAGLPAGCISIVFGVPDTISRHLLASPIIRKISFTGSVPVGKHLIKLAADGLKRTTMELGGHAPVLVFDDADIDATLDLAVQRKYRNSGQVCVSPTRFFVQEKSYQHFVDGFAARAKKIKVGDGLNPDTQMGPMVHTRRRDAIEALVQDATAKGARLLAGGERVGNEGAFYAPTVLADVPDHARIMHEEPFGPVAVLNPFGDLEDGIAKTNSLPYGLAAYAFTSSASNINRLGDAIEAGMVGINSFNISTPETPFGGVKDSGHGSEVGIEGIEAFLVTKTLSIT